MRQTDSATGEAQPAAPREDRLEAPSVSLTPPAAGPSLRASRGCRRRLPCLDAPRYPGLPRSGKPHTEKSQPSSVLLPLRVLLSTGGRTLELRATRRSTLG